MGTGDLKNNLGKFVKLVRQMKLSQEADSIPNLLSGEPKAFLPLLHQAFLHYSLPLSKWLAEQGCELYGRNDLRFVETMYRILRDLFSHKPPLTKDQFLGKGFAECKLIMSTRILELCKDKHNQLSKKHVKKRNYSCATQSKSAPKYRKPMKVEPEIFNVHGSASGFAVWEETQCEVRLETPFRSQQQQQQQPSVLPRHCAVQTTPAPSPRKRVPLPQFMGQISPRKSCVTDWARSGPLTDLDVTPAVTPLKASVRVEREMPVASSAQSVSTPLDSNGRTRHLVTPLYGTNLYHQTLNSGETVQRIRYLQVQDTSCEARNEPLPMSGVPTTADHTDLPSQTSPARTDRVELSRTKEKERDSAIPKQMCSEVDSTRVSSALEERIRELTDCMQKMSAKMVLLETQLIINKEKAPGESRGEQASSCPSPLKENVQPETEEQVSGVGDRTPLRGTAAQGPAVPLQPAAYRLPTADPLRPQEESDSDDLQELLSLSKGVKVLRPTNTPSDPNLITSEALIAQLRNRSQDTRRLFHSALTRSSV